MTEIAAHDFHLVLSPSQGGAVDALQWRGIDLLCPTRAPSHGAISAPTDRAGFPLVPFSGRISGSQFVFQDQTIKLTPNFLPEPNAIHGFGWHQPWLVTEQSAASVTLSHRFDTPEWPASYLATQTFTLSETALELEMTLTNTGTRAMPAGLGWHPYFVAAGAHIQSHVGAIWRPENAQATPQPEALGKADDLNTRQAVETLALDHCFSSTQAETVLDWPDRGLRIRMTASDIFGAFVLYTPKGEAYFCAEPISHVPDAVNLPNPPSETGLRLLKPSETLAGSIKIEPSRSG
ncbi:MAG: aldose 1-epimerase [Hyphomonadaceae bacterium]